ncbi:hypothetical protein RvY_18112 [Ramazzottius varieornatus]|uniref:Choline transporter-like protein n=1 Tax=Ramazzottius varieornatus TaxID=947166 RepID=A0A1D1W4Q5_RAMVA|nr:hypothetical protein RvY_18112 [Ramazzottius varieornatus]
MDSAVELEERPGVFGPVCYHSVKHQPRRCTDLPCCFCFLLFTIFLILTAVVAAIFGAPLRLLYGQDSFGNVCGAANQQIENRTMTGMDMSQRPFVFSFDISNPRNALQLCVHKCPDRRLSTLRELEEFAVQKHSGLCMYNVQPEQYRNSDSVMVTAEECAAIRSDPVAVQVVDDYGPRGCLLKMLQWRQGFGMCPKLPVEASDVILNRCVPSKNEVDMATVYDYYAYLNSFDLHKRVMADFYASYRQVIGLTITALVASILIIVVLRFAPGAVVHMILSVAAVGTTVTSALLWFSWSTLKRSLDNRLFDGPYDVLQEETKNEVVLFVFAIFVTALSAILLLTLLFARRHGSQVVKIFEEASRCIGEMPSLLAQPLWTFLFLATFFAFWFYVMLCLATSDLPRFVKKEIQFGNDTVKRAISNTTFTVVEYEDHTILRLLWVCYAFALIWVSEFILAAQQMVVASAVSMWYFEKDKKDCQGPVISSIKQLILYHLGSVALGAVTITALKIPRLLLLAIKKLWTPEDSVVHRERTSGWWGHFQRWLIDINHNAYAIVSVQGINFFPAAAEAHDLLHEYTEVVPMIQINRLVDFILFLGKVAVTSIVAICGIVSMKYDPQLHLFGIPLLICCVFAYFIAHCVLSLYEVVIDTLFLCYCEDLRIHEYCDEVEPASGYDTVDHPSAPITVHSASAKTYFAKPGWRELMQTPMDKNDIQMTGFETILHR